ncbi:Cytochrome c oxidase subunit 5C [Rhynchospora pubera]|uniref:Cytochrome c oxidase subunit 5C n=1 Tax=Rhynchospora pubera TaxID=906938 RepID=A0AAV8FUS4_9POAL|nr:Cytochrome c oxidase subunit 5C [Rhynchospora pubera]
MNFIIIGEWGATPSRTKYILNSGNRQMAAHKVAHVVYKGPSVVKEICIGLTLGVMAGTLWKMNHWNQQRRAREFYDMLEKGQISVVAPEE